MVYYISVRFEMIAGLSMDKMKSRMGEIFLIIITDYYYNT